jgi:hypothetical protein
MSTCPVCGYNRLVHEPREGTICPSCYTEFGYDDTTLTPAELRQEWLANGPRWEGVNVMPRPYDWQPYEQLKNIGVIKEPTLQSTDEPQIEIVDLGHQTTHVSIGNDAVTIRGHLYALGHSVASIIAPTATTKGVVYAP